MGHCTIRLTPCDCDRVSAEASRDVAALRADSPSPDGFGRSVLVVASPPPADTASPESIEVLDAAEPDWPESTTREPPESLHSSNSSCHTLVSADGGATYNATAALPRGRTVDSPGDSSSSESFIRLGVGATPLTSPDAGNLTSPDVEVVTSPEAGQATSPDVEVVTSPDEEVVEPGGGGAPADEASACSSDAGNVTSPDVEVVTSPEGELVARPEAAQLAVPEAVPRATAARPDSAPGSSPASVEPADSNSSVGPGGSTEPASSESVSSVDAVSFIEPANSEPVSSVEEPVSSEPVSSVEPISSLAPLSSEPDSSAVEPVSSTSECVERVVPGQGPVASSGVGVAEQRPHSATPPREASAEPSSGSADR